MKLIKRDYLRGRVYSYYKKINIFEKKFTFDHFISERESKLTIYDKINRFKSGKLSNHQQEVGRPAKIFVQKAKAELKQLANNNYGESQKNLIVAFNSLSDMSAKLLWTLV